jgi:hypothetical protein
MAKPVEWSMWKPILSDLLAAADELSAGIVAWSPLGGGLLTGTVTRLDGDFCHNAHGSTAAQSLSGTRSACPARGSRCTWPWSSGAAAAGSVWRRRAVVAGRATR